MSQEPPPISWPYGLAYEIPPSGDSRLTDISERLAALYGYEREELLEPRAWERLVPDEAERMEELIHYFLSGADHWEGRVRIRTKGGAELVVETQQDVVSRTAEAVHVVARVRDVTEQVLLEDKLKELETRLQALNQQLRLIMWSADPDLRFTWSWGSALADLGLKENELVGMTFYEYLQTDDPEFPAIAAELRALKGEHVTYEMEWMGRTYRCPVEPHFDRSGRVLGTIGTAVDITDPAHLLEETRAIGRTLGGSRIAGEAAWPTGQEILEVGPLRVDVEAFEATLAGTRLDLTPTEFRLLTELARRPGRVVTRATLLRNVWGYDFLGGGSLITMAIKRLRSKIERDPTHPEIIETVRGVGYKLRAD